MATFFERKEDAHKDSLYVGAPVASVAVAVLAQDDCGPNGALGAVVLEGYTGLVQKGKEFIMVAFEPLVIIGTVTYFRSHLPHRPGQPPGSARRPRYSLWGPESPRKNKPNPSNSPQTHPKGATPPAQYIEGFGGEAPIGHSLLHRIQRPAGNALVDSTGSHTGYAVQTLPNNLQLVIAQGKPPIANSPAPDIRRGGVAFGQRYGILLARPPLLPQNPPNRSGEK